jgi:hypothetical protein
MQTRNLVLGPRSGWGLGARVIISRARVRVGASVGLRLRVQNHTSVSARVVLESDTKRGLQREH